MTAVLNLSGVCKTYPEYRSSLYRFARWFGAPVRPTSVFSAITDVSFSLQPGEAMALIGQNGAGKSTLLKLIAGTVRPTAGTIAVRGRVSAILELGLGFNPEFTGRENVLHSGALLGHSESELHALIPQIEAFAEIGAFFDQPLRIYSSGMQARLAFALATAVRPDILIVDEVLSVGDAYFQHKCFARIQEFKREGTALLIVTHSLESVRTLCDTAIWIDEGRVARAGDAVDVIDYYRAWSAEKEKSLTVIEQKKEEGRYITKSGDGRAILQRLQILDAKTNDDLSTVEVGQMIDIVGQINVLESLDRLVVGFLVRDRAGHAVWGTNTWHTQQVLRNVHASAQVEVIFRIPCNLGPGSYSITYNLVSSFTKMEENYESQDNFLVFEVVNTKHPFFVGVAWLDSDTSIRVLK